MRPRPQAPAEWDIAENTHGLNFDARGIGLADLAVAARRDGRSLPKGWLGLPSVADGANGVRFIDACVHSNEASGAWVNVV